MQLILCALQTNTMLLSALSSSDLWFETPLKCIAFVWMIHLFDEPETFCDNKRFWIQVFMRDVQSSFRMYLHTVFLGQLMSWVIHINLTKYGSVLSLATSFAKKSSSVLMPISKCPTLPIERLPS